MWTQILLRFNVYVTSHGPRYHYVYVTSHGPRYHYVYVTSHGPRYHYVLIFICPRLLIIKLYRPSI